MRSESTQMKQIAWSILLLAPLVGLAQSDGRGAPATELRPPEATKATAMMRPPGLRELSLTEVFDRLGLNPQQRDLWDVFNNKVDAYTGVYYRQKPTTPSPEDPAPHQIGRMVDNLQNRLAALEDVEAAVKILYASLTLQQQKIANEMLILAIPAFTTTSSESGRSSAESRRKEGKPDEVKRSRRGGVGGGSTGPMSGN
jgi:hypothetical protein